MMRNPISMRLVKSIWSYSFVIACLLLAACSLQLERPMSGATLFEGARLITGDGSTIENSAFIVENKRFTRVGRRGELPVPAGAAHVDLTGKTVIPALIDGALSHDRPGLNGKRTINARQAKALAARFNVSPAAFL